jgi:hypothetical protein
LPEPLEGCHDIPPNGTTQRGSQSNEIQQNGSCQNSQIAILLIVLSKAIWLIVIRLSAVLLNVTVQVRFMAVSEYHRKLGREYFVKRLVITISEIYSIKTFTFVN